MAVDVCSEISSPRISFSHDLNELGDSPLSDFSISDPTIDFDFCVAGTLEISSADELFSNGRIRPLQIKEVTIARPKPVPGPSQAHSNPLIKPIEIETTNKKKRLIEFLSANCDGEDQEKSAAKPFWQFRRSSSDNSRANGLFRSLQFLTRSNSTGSVPNPKRPPAFSRGIQKQNSLKETSTNSRPNSPAPIRSYYPYNNGSAKKPSLRKSRSYGIGNGIRVNPVLNIPPSYIAKGTVSLFGSFFCSKKSKKKRK